MENGMYEIVKSKRKLYYQDGKWFRFKKKSNGTIDLYDIKSQPNLKDKLIKRLQL